MTGIPLRIHHCDVIEGYRNQGIATEIVSGLVNEIQRICAGAPIIIRIDKDNYASRKVAEKCGGVLVKYEDSYMSRIICTLKEKCKERGVLSENDAEFDNIRNLMEEGKESICIYELT